MDYITIKEASRKWNTGIRIIAKYCKEGRIPGAIKRGNIWLIPKNAAKPIDKRFKGNKTAEESKWNFSSLYEETDLFVKIIKEFPYPMHICAPDGTLLLANDAFLKFANITNPEMLYKKHNILTDPSLERWGVLDFTQRAFNGEPVRAFDVKVPYREIIERLGDIKTSQTGSLYHDMTAFPITEKDGRLKYIVFIFITSREYRGREDIVKGMEYIDNHWREDFDIDKLAKEVYVSKYRYIRLFKMATGMTPYGYYQEVKVKKIKEKLCEKNMLVSRAFAECGVDYSGSFVKIFRQKTGISPSQYRKEMLKDTTV